MHSELNVNELKLKQKIALKTSPENRIRDDLVSNQ